MSDVDGGPAFPCTEPSRIEVSPGGAQTREWPINLGMSLRDWLAGQALQGLTSLSNDDYEELSGFYKVDIGVPSVHVIAYRMADAMLKERASE